jgi:HK97 family phage major capsid protein
LLGYRVVTNPDMPQLGAGNTPIAFGDFATFVVRDVTMEKIVRMTDSAPTLKGQEWFLGVARSGGAYTDAGGAIKLFKNAAV